MTYCTVMLISRFGPPRVNFSTTPKTLPVLVISKYQPFPHPPTSILPYHDTTTAYTVNISGSIAYIHVL